MGKIVDTSVWVDLFRPKTPPALRKLAASYIDSKSYLCDPVAFELLRSSPKKNRYKLENFLKQYPKVDTPSQLWQQATRLSQACQAKGFTLGVMDLLIAQSALSHALPLVTFDKDFLKLKKVSSLEVIWQDRQLSLH